MTKKARLFVGPFDLSNSLGCPLHMGETPKLLETITKIRLAAEKAGKFTGIFATGVPDAKRRYEEGWGFISIGNDVSFIQGAMKANLKATMGDGQGVGGGY